MLLLKEKTEVIIGCFYKVYNTLGYGFLEKVYENALLVELFQHGLICQQQSPINVFYKEVSVGLYFADVVIDHEIIIEVKAGKGEILVPHEMQLLNYLKATRFEIGIILHFGEKPTFKRRILTNNLK